MALDINSADPTELLMFHDCMTPLNASAIAKRRPDAGYRNLRELETLNSDLEINWDELEPLLEFKVPNAFANRWVNLISNSYGPPSPTFSKNRKAASKGNEGFEDLGEAVLNQIKKRYGS